ncbi:MAG: LLM class flavin-dependent oxidoreductase [Dehalococcoidia bacterium]
MTVEFWSNGAGMPSAFVRRAKHQEEAGYDGITIVDSQNLSGDSYVALAMAGAETERIKLGTGVTNPFTRHAAVTACAIATVHAVSGGRAQLGIGRGDSALAHLGYSPAAPETLATYLRKLQGYLSGEEVAFDDTGDLDRLGLANQPTSSKIEWIRPGRYPKVLVDVAATGPKVIRIAAQLADAVTLAVGADPARLQWGIDTARAARRVAGLDPDDLTLGAYINCVVEDDPAEAAHLGEGGLTVFARFSTMHGEPVGPTSETERTVMRSLHDAYDMTSHSRAGSPQAATLTTEFAREYGIFGPPAYCIERLTEVARMGITRLVIVGPSRDLDPARGERAEARFAEEVMPAVREAVG